MKSVNQIILILLLAIFSSNTFCQEAPTLTAEEQLAVEELKDAGIISYYKGSEQIVSVDPDLFNQMNFQQRRMFTIRLCVYINRYVKRDLTMDDWWIRIENMATGKRMAKWDNLSGYKEFK